MIIVVRFTVLLVFKLSFLVPFSNGSSREEPSVNRDPVDLQTHVRGPTWTSPCPSDF